MAVEKKKRKRKKSGLVEIWRRLQKNRIAVVSFFILIVLVLIALFAPLLAPYGFDQQFRGMAFSPPSREHLLGNDALGRDILSRLIYGSRQSLQMGIYAVGISAVLGILIGAIAGYYGGWVDNVTMRLLDIYSSIPTFLLAVTLASILGPSLRNAIIAIGIGIVPGSARLMRASILTVREMEYVEAAKTVNASTFRIVRKHIIPNAISPMIVSITMGMGNSILAAAGLSFIGLGVQPPIPEWGSMISEARSFLRAHGSLAIYPGICVMITVLAFNLLGDGLRDALDPRLNK